jgi:hypothetical protein
MKPQINWQEQELNSHSIGVAKKAIRDLTDRNHKKYWESIIGLKQTKGSLSGLSARIKKDLFRLNRDQLRWVVGLLTSHCHLKNTFSSLY